MASRWATQLRSLQHLPDMLKWTAGVVGGIAAVVTAYNQLSATVDPLIKKYLNPVPSQRPGVVIIGTKNGREPLPVSPALKSYLTGGRVKLIGMGWLGAALFPKLEAGSVLGRIAHDFDSSILLDSEAPPDITAGLPMAQPLRLYDENVAATVNDVAVQDNGSLSLLGAHGIARHTRQSECRGQYWPVLMQGNSALWGYGGADANKLTDTGKRLFVNVVKHAQSTPFEIAEFDRQYFNPGIYKGTLGCNFTTSQYRFKANQVGDIRLRVTSRENLALILNGPGKVNAYARVDRTSPSLTYHVTAEDLAHGDEWFASVSYFGPVTADSRIEYELEMSHPPLKSVNLLIWLIVGALGLGLLAFALFRILKALKLAAARRGQK